MRICCFALMVVGIVAITARLSAADAYTIRQIGLTNSEPTNSPNYFADGVLSMNDSGQVVGVDYHSDNTGEQNAWVYLPSTGMTQQIGLTGAAYNAWGYTTNLPQFLSRTGIVVGYATRYDLNEVGNNNG